jgi:hypothetical protein
MSIYHDELKRRLDSDEPSVEIAYWYLHGLALPSQQIRGLTALEQKFLRDLAEGIKTHGLRL